MEKFELYPATKKHIMRRVWLAWAVRAFWPVAALAGVVIFESFMVSIPQIARASFEAASSISSFGAYWAAAFTGAELYVFAGIAVFAVGCYGTVRNALQGFYKKENIFIRERVV